MDWKSAYKGMAAFSGAVTASATHEIKNELAVINEQSGLIKELLMLAAQGREVDPSRLESLISRVIVRIGQADVVIKRLNTFAHSGDLDRDLTNVADSVALVVEFYKRLASIKGLTLELGQMPEALGLAHPPMLFQQAVWACLAGAAEAAEKGGAVVITAAAVNGQTEIKFSANYTQTPQGPSQELLEALGCRLTADSGNLILCMAE